MISAYLHILRRSSRIPTPFCGIHEAGLKQLLSYAIYLGRDNFTHKIISVFPIVGVSKVLVGNSATMTGSNSLTS